MEDEKMPVKGFGDERPSQFGPRDIAKEAEDFELKNGRLLIGGPCDGQRRVPRDIRRHAQIEVAVPIVSVVSKFCFPLNPVAAKLEYAIYEPEILRGKEIEILFYRHSSLTTDDALRLLFERYPKQ